MTDAELARARDLGGATYLSSCCHMLARKLGVDDLDNEAINAMALKMLPALNIAMETAWRGLMHDDEGMTLTLKRFEYQVTLLLEDRSL